MWKHAIKMLGNETFKQAVTRLVEVSREALEHNRVDINDVTLFVPHQANLRIITAVGKRLGIDDPLLTIAKNLEQAALRDDYFVSRKLYPNVDFYSGIIMRAIGIPMEMFTTMFAIGRAPGYIANWKEVASNPKGRIYRPRQIYVGPPKRDYVPMGQRS